MRYGWCFRRVHDNRDFNKRAEQAAVQDEPGLLIGVKLCPPKPDTAPAPRGEWGGWGGRKRYRFHSVLDTQDELILCRMEDTQRDDQKRKGETLAGAVARQGYLCATAKHRSSAPFTNTGRTCVKPLKIPTSFIQLRPCARAPAPSGSWIWHRQQQLATQARSRQETSRQP